MEQVNTLLIAFQQASTSDQRRSLADQLRNQLATLPPNEATTARQALKEFVCREAKISIERIDTALVSFVHHA